MARYFHVSRVSDVSYSSCGCDYRLTSGQRTQIMEILSHSDKPICLFLCPTAKENPFVVLDIRYELTSDPNMLPAPTSLVADFPIVNPVYVRNIRQFQDTVFSLDPEFV